VSADPSWTADRISVTVIIIMEPGWLPETPPDRELTVADVDLLATAAAPDLARRLIDPSESPETLTGVVEALQERWAQMCPPEGQVAALQFEFVGADEMTVAAYWATQSLDLEFLSHDLPGPPSTS
jgi:hypothetical protein